MHIELIIGDGKTVEIPIAILPWDPTSILFSCKASLDDLDPAAKFQKSLGAGIVTGVNQDGAKVAIIELLHADTSTLTAGRYYWDLKASGAGTSPITVEVGLITLKRGVTRGLTTSIPVNTTQPPIMMNGEQIAAEFEAVNERIDNLVLTGGEPGTGGAVSSVNAKTGAVVLTKADLTLGNVDNTADAAKPVSTLQATAIAAAENNAKAASRASNWVPSWNDVTNKPLTFSPSAHGHDWSEVTGKPSFFSGSYTDLTNKPALFDGTWGSLSGKPSFGPFSSGTDAADLTGQIALARLPTSTGLQVLRANAANTALEFATISVGGGDMLKSDNLSGLTNYVTARTNLGLGSAALAATGDFAPASHPHAIADTTDLQTTLDAKQAINSELTAILAALTGTGYLRRTGANTYVVDTPSGAVGPDLTAIEALTGTGYPRRTGADTWVLDTPSGGAPAQTDAAIDAGTDTEQRTASAAQLKRAARAHAAQRGFKAYNSGSAASISIAASTWTKVPAAMLDVEAWDSDGWWNAATARFQPTIAGWYLIAGGALFANPPDQTRYVIGVLYNGINPGQTGNNSPMLARCAQSGTAVTGGCGAVMAYLNGSTDYAELCVFQGSGGPTDLLGGVGAIAYNNFSAILIRSDS